MAVMGQIAWADSAWHRAYSTSFAASPPVVDTPTELKEILEFRRVFRGRELTPKQRRIACGLLPLDNLIEGGLVRGRISEIIAETGAGKTSLAAAFAAAVTKREATAWIATSDDFDPASIAAAGVDLSRLLWVSSKGVRAGTSAPRASRIRVITASLKAAEWILAVGGFGLVILDFGGIAPQLPQSAALRLARAAERSDASVLVLAPHRACGTFAALSLTLRREQACFSRLWPGGPALFDGLMLEACVRRNKLGKSGQTAKWNTVIERDYEALAGHHSAEKLNADGSRTLPADSTHSLNSPSEWPPLRQASNGRF